MADQLDGKQLKNSTVADGKLVESYSKSDGTRAFTGAVLGVDPTLAQHLATKNYVDALFQGRTVKQMVRLATTVSITLSGNQTIDGVLTVTGDRIFDKNNSNATLRGIYIAASGAWTRTTDFDADADVSAGVIIPVSEGSANSDTAWELTTDNPITLGTTGLSFSYYAGIKSSTITTSNKNMTASVTVNDFDAACATTLVAAPNRNGMCIVVVNGLNITVGDAVKTKSCYFSSDGGTTAKALSALAAGDILYWVQSYAGYNLAATDKIDFIYDVSQ